MIAFIVFGVMLLLTIGQVVLLRSVEPARRKREQKRKEEAEANNATV